MCLRFDSYSPQNRDLEWSYDDPSFSYYPSLLGVTSCSHNLTSNTARNGPSPAYWGNQKSRNGTSIGSFCVIMQFGSFFGVYPDGKNLYGPTAEASPSAPRLALRCCISISLRGPFIRVFFTGVWIYPKHIAITMLPLFDLWLGSTIFSNLVIICHRRIIGVIDLWTCELLNATWWKQAKQQFYSTSMWPLTRWTA